MEKPQSFYIFSDIDGTFMNHNNYCYESIINFVELIKKKCEIIFVSSKTFSEIKIINEKLNIEFPFIVENGACIYFPKKYKINYKKKQFHEDYFSVPLCMENLKLQNKKIKKIGEKFKFTFFNEISHKDLQKLTKLGNDEILSSKKREFSDPLIWLDTKKNFSTFKSKLSKYGYRLSEGGRFIHISKNYDKATAVKFFLKLINFKADKNIKTISLGDSQNDTGMLEMTDYSCIIKSPKKIYFILKIKTNIIVNIRHQLDGRNHY